MLVRNAYWQMRQQFWIPKQRSAVQKVMMAASPTFHTTAYQPCFTHTGVDYFGLLNIKRGRAVVKSWGAIVTCLNSRAVQLELATSLEPDQPILLGPKERSEKPLTTGTRNRSGTSCYRRDASGYFNHLRLHTPVMLGRGWSLVQPNKKLCLLEEPGNLYQDWDIVYNSFQRTYYSDLITKATHVELLFLLIRSQEAEYCLVRERSRTLCRVMQLLHHACYMQIHHQIA